MKKFRFRLEAALRLRELEADAERAKLQELLSQKSRWARALAASNEDRISASRSLQTETGFASAGDLRSLASYLVGLEAQKRTIADALERADKAVAAQQKRLLAAKLKERTLNQLREKRLAEWQRDLDAEFERMSQELWRPPGTPSKNDEPAMDQ